MDAQERLRNSNGNQRAGREKLLRCMLKSKYKERDISKPQKTCRKGRLRELKTTCVVSRVARP